MQSGCVNIWHRATGSLLAQLDHPQTVNSVAWCLTDPHMLASACDDHSVRIWLAPAVSNPATCTNEQQSLLTADWCFV